MLLTLRSSSRFPVAVIRAVLRSLLFSHLLFPIPVLHLHKAPLSLLSTTRPRPTSFYFPPFPFPYDCLSLYLFDSLSLLPQRHEVWKDHSRSRRPVL